MSKFRQNFVWVLTGSVVYSASNWGVLSAFARTSTPEGLGYFAYGLALSNPVFSFLSLNLRGLVASDAKGDLPLPHLIGVRYITNLIGLLVMAVIAMLASGPIELKASIVLVAIGKSFDASVGLLLGYYQRRQQMSMIALAQSANGIFSLLFATVLLILWDGNPILGALGYAIGSVASSRVLWILARNRSKEAIETFRPLYDVPTIKKIVFKGLPLGAAISISAANVAILRHAIGAGVSMHALGIFSALSYGLVPLSMAVNALGQAALPTLSRSYAYSPREYLGRAAAVSGVALSFGGLAYLGARLLGDVFLSLAYGHEYAEYFDLLTALAFAGMISCASSIMTYILLSAGSTRVQLLMSIAGLGSTLVGSLLFIPKLQLDAGPVVLTLSSSAQVTAGLIALLHFSRRRNQADLRAST